MVPTNPVRSGIKEEDIASAMVRFLLRSPLLWIGMLVAAYISWLWVKSTAQPIGFSYSSGDLQIVVAAGNERFMVWMGWGPRPDFAPGFQAFAPGKFDGAYVVYFVTLLQARGPVWFGGSWISWSFRALLGGYLALWYGVLGLRAWRYHRKHKELADVPIQPAAEA